MNKPKSITNEQSIDILQHLSYRDRLICRIMSESGLRISDVLNMTVQEVGLYLVFGLPLLIKQRKTGKFKNVELSLFLQKSLENYLKTIEIRQKYLFSQRKADAPIARSTVYRALQRAMRKTGIFISPHSFRKLYARNLYVQTHDIFTVQHALGHKYITTTATYLDIDVNALILNAIQ